MKSYTSPSLEEVYTILTENNDLIKLLSDKGCLITKESLYDDYTIEQIDNMEMEIYINNRDTMYDVAQVLLDNEEYIMDNEVSVLVRGRKLEDSLMEAMNIAGEEPDDEVMATIFYTYKYCCVSSFFQNNKASFMADIDYEALENNEYAKAMLDSLLKEFDKMSTIITNTEKFQRIDDIPEDYVNYFSQLFGIEKATFGIVDGQEKLYREIVRNIIDIYRYKGTNYMIETFFDFMGIVVSIKEFYFDRRFYYLNESYSNPYTEISELTNFKTYLTTVKPSYNVKVLNDDGDNVLEINETVKDSDFTKQYNLTEFQVLAKKYGAPAVLGYSKYDENGELYTGKVYKYFKTNYIQFEPTKKTNSSATGSASFTADEHIIINKWRRFFTPLYIYSEVKYNISNSDETEIIGWDGDGVNWDIDTEQEFLMLDSESWDTISTVDDLSKDSMKQLVSMMAISDSNGTYYTLTDTNEQEAYYSSISESKIFRLPVGKKVLKNVNTTKGLGKLKGYSYLSKARVRSYILQSYLNESSSITQDNLQYDIPPTSKTTNLWRTIYNPTEETDITGYGSNSIKTMTRDRDLKTKIDHVVSDSLTTQTDKNIFMATNEDYNSVELARTSNTKFYFITSVNIENSTFSSVALKYNEKYNFINFQDSQNYMEIYESEVSNFGSPTLLRNSNNLLRIISIGDYVAVKNSTETKLSVYRYGFNISNILTSQYILSPLFTKNGENISTITLSSGKTFSSYGLALVNFRNLSVSSSNPISIYKKRYIYKSTEDSMVYAPKYVGESDTYTTNQEYEYSTLSEVPENSETSYRTLYSEDGETFYTNSLLEKTATLLDTEFPMKNSLTDTGSFVATKKTTKKAYENDGKYYFDSDYTEEVSDDYEINYIGYLTTYKTLYGDTESVMNYYTTADLDEDNLTTRPSGYSIKNIKAKILRTYFTYKILYKGDSAWYSDINHENEVEVDSSAVFYDNEDGTYNVGTTSSELIELYYNSDNDTYYTDEEYLSSTYLKSNEITQDEDTYTSTTDTVKYYTVLFYKTTSTTLYKNGDNYYSDEECTTAVDISEYELSILAVSYTEKTIYYDGTNYYSDEDMTQITSIDGYIISSSYTVVNSEVGKKVFVGASKITEELTYDYMKSTGLYNFARNKYHKGELIYSLADEKLYEVKNFGIYGIEEKELKGRLILDTSDTDNITGYIYEYDGAWDGATQNNDEEDGILYNHEHSVTWDLMSMKNSVIDRPIEREEEENFTSNTALKLISEICSQTADAFNGQELWYYTE